MNVDPSGEWFETLLDIVSVVKSFVNFVRNPTWGTGLTLAYDCTAAVTPGLPGSYVTKVANKVSNTVKYAKKASSSGGAKVSKGASKAVNNMSEFFKTEFGGTIKSGVNKTKQQVQVQSIYEVTKKLNNPYLKKGDKFYLDNLHKDHFEVFDKNGKLRVVLNLDGTLNAAKTEKAYGRILK